MERSRKTSCAKLSLMRWWTTEIPACESRPSMRYAVLLQRAKSSQMTTCLRFCVSGCGKIRARTSGFRARRRFAILAPGKNSDDAEKYLGADCLEFRGDFIRDGYANFRGRFHERQSQSDEKLRPAPHRRIERFRCVARWATSPFFDRPRQHRHSLAKFQQCGLQGPSRNGCFAEGREAASLAVRRRRARNSRWCFAKREIIREAEQRTSVGYL